MRLYAFLKYMQHKFLANNKQSHLIKSPFVFDLLLNVIDINGGLYSYHDINSIRYRLMSSDEIIEIIDYGKVSEKQKSEKLRIKDILQNYSVDYKYGQLLYRLVNKFQPNVILEFGTCLGISSMYLAKANSTNQVITIEGCESLAKIAQANFKSLSIENIEIFIGDFDYTLTKVFSGIKSLDFVFFDGDYRKEDTIRYFEACLPLTNEDSVFVFYQIYCSSEMEKAWKYIKKHSQVVFSIDLFKMGLVFFNTKHPKKHYKLKF